MKYVVRSQMMSELPRSWPRILKRVLLSFCYLGALFAPALILSLPFQWLHRNEVSPLVTWLVSFAMGFVVLRLLQQAWISTRRYLLLGIIQVESVLMVMALLFAIAAVVCLYPPK